MSLLKAFLKITQLHNNTWKALKRECDTRIYQIRWNQSVQVR